jgi:S-DNA-T family DNA segregation ATPase FtsK/SpoIIIE
MVKSARRSGWPRMAALTATLRSELFVAKVKGGLAALVGAVLVADLITYHAGDASFDSAGRGPPANLLGSFGADLADLGLQLTGLTAWLVALLLLVQGARRLVGDRAATAATRSWPRILAGVAGTVLAALALAAAPPPASWPLATGLGGLSGDGMLGLAIGVLPGQIGIDPRWIIGPVSGGLAALALAFALDALRWPVLIRAPAVAGAAHVAPASRGRRQRKAEAAPEQEVAIAGDAAMAKSAPDDTTFAPDLAIKPPKASVRSSGREERETQPPLPFPDAGFRLPELIMLAKPKPRASAFDEIALRQNAQMLESVLAEFGVRGQIDNIRPGPVVTLYELVPAPGVKSARVVALSDDIARSMSVAACRVSVVPGRNAIGIELPNARRETVYLRDLLSSAEYEKSSQALPLALGETIGGEPYIVDLAKMPHLLIAGTTGSGKSVGVNAMILSILYRLPPEKCRFIMIDPKMLELSIYDGIPHLLTPVVTDPKKAIVALKWTVREMEDRYRRMSKIGVRNVAGYNDRAHELMAKGEHFVRTVQTGFDEHGRPVFEEERINPEPMPYLVVVIDEVADLMMVAGKDIEGLVQRLAQMARAAGIHLIMATQRPSVDVITGTIKANFPTRISFQVTSKIDSRTIMGEQGAEQLLGMGDMLYMAGGGRITRLHGPYVDDEEVIKVAKFLRDQGEPQYLEEVTAPTDDDLDSGAAASEEGSAGNELYDQAVAVVTRDRKASTSYIQRRLQIGYNRAASLIERMEREGVVTAANHAGKRDILAPPPP